MTITVRLSRRGGPSGKLANVELYFPNGDLAGLKLTGFGAWEAAPGRPPRVTFPSRNSNVNGDRCNVLLRPIVEARLGPLLLEWILVQRPVDGLNEIILDAFNAAVAARPAEVADGQSPDRKSAPLPTPDAQATTPASYPIPSCGLRIMGPGPRQPYNVTPSPSGPSRPVLAWPPRPACDNDWPVKP